MLNFTISQKLLGLFLINLIIVVIIVWNGYIFVNKNASNLKAIDKNALPVTSLHTSNLYILKIIRKEFQESTIINEEDILISTLALKEKIIHNFKLLNEYNVNTQKQEEVFNNYFDYGYDFSSKIIKNKIFEIEEAAALQKYSNEVCQLFEELEILAKQDLSYRLDTISNDTNMFFKDFLVVFFLALLIMFILGFYVYETVKYRFDNILKLVKNLIKEEPDFSVRIENKNNDEIGQLIELFNQLSDKLEYAHNKSSQEFLSEIEETQKEVVFTMGSIAESRSKETGNHVKRVAEYSKLLALYYGLDKDDAEMLKQASPMHDIGKVAIADAILNKPGRLTDEERKAMDKHVILGYEMLKCSHRPLLQAASIVALEHHEKWDGTGYPNAKIGENIHIFGRITAIADVFDALGSARVYKIAWDDERIFTLFKEERGKHFDPQLIDIFFDKIDEFLIIRDTFKD